MIVLHKVGGRDHGESEFRLVHGLQPLEGRVPTVIQHHIASYFGKSQHSQGKK